jgi:hypothetical protein
MKNLPREFPSLPVRNTPLPALLNPPCSLRARKSCLQIKEIHSIQLPPKLFPVFREPKLPPPLFELLFSSLLSLLRKVLKLPAGTAPPPPPFHLETGADSK